MTIVSKTVHWEISCLIINEPVSSIKYKFACTYSEDSNQSEHPQSDQS